MSRFDGYLNRFRIERERVIANQVLVSGGGRASEGPTDILWSQSHGFASRPPKGSAGFTAALAGRPSQLVALGGENPDLRPTLDAGNAVLYDHKGHVVKVFDDGLAIDVKDKVVAINAGAGFNVTVTGANAFVSVPPGNKLFLGGDGSEGTYSKVVTEAGPSINVWARIG